MEEEANLDVGQVGQTLPEQRRQQHQMIIVDPDHVAILRHLPDGRGKGHIGAVMGVPVCLVKFDASGEVVEEGPDGATDISPWGDETPRDGDAYLLEKPL